MEFLDTNVLVYAASLRQEDWNKTQAAHRLLRSGVFAISLQVLQEFYCASRSPRELAISHEEALRFCQQWRVFTVLEPTPRETHERKAAFKKSLKHDLLTGRMRVNQLSLETVLQP